MPNSTWTWVRVQRLAGFEPGTTHAFIIGDYFLHDANGVEQVYTFYFMFDYALDDAKHIVTKLLDAVQADASTHGWTTNRDMIYYTQLGRG